MAQARCPQCSTMVLVVPGAPTVCPKCGYGGAARKPAASPPVRPTPAAPAPAPKEPERSASMSPGQRIAFAAALAGLVLLAAGVAAYSFLG